MNTTVRLAVAFLAALSLSACSTLRGGGAPELSFDLNSDLEKIAKEFESSTNITSYYRTAAADRLDARNRFASGRLVQIDLQYLKFIRTLTADKQQLDAATEIAAMTLNLAGTLVGSARAKTNLAAAAAAVGGAKTTIDKDFYYEKSIDALVATMNAKRKEVLVIVLSGLTLPVDQYPFERALTDLHQYYLAGTLNGAIQFINTQAAQSEVVSNKELKKVLFTASVPTQNEIANTKLLTDSLGAITIDKASKALKALGVADSQIPTSLDDANGQIGAKRMLQGKIRAAESLRDAGSRAKALDALIAAFKSAGVIN